MQGVLTTIYIYIYIYIAGLQDNSPTENSPKKNEKIKLKKPNLTYLY